MNLNLYSYFCFLGFVASSFFSPTARSVCLVAGLFLWGLSLLQKQQAQFVEAKVQSIDWIFRFLLVYIFANLFVELVHSHAMVHWLKGLVSTYAQCFWGYALISQKQDRAKLVQQMVIGFGGLLALIVVLQLVGLVPMVGSYYGVLSQPFTSSGMLLVSFFLALAYLGSTMGKEYWILQSVIVLQVIALFALGQRSTWLGVLLALLIYTFVQKLYYKKRFWFGLAALALVGTLVSNASPRVQRKLEKFMQPQTWLASNTIQERKQIWNLNYQAWKHKPGFGIGKIVEYKGLAHAHNIYLQQLFSGGIFKFAAWLLLYSSIGIALFRLLGTQPEAFLAYLALSVEGLMENWWGDGEVLTLFVVLVLLALVSRRTSTQ